MGSFNFGYNIGSTNLPTPLILDFYAQRYFPDYIKLSLAVEEKSVEFKTSNKAYQDALAELEVAKNASEPQQTKLDELTSSSIKLNETLAASSQNLADNKLKLDEAKVKVDQVNKLLWTITNVLFVIGGMIGAFGSKYVLDFLGRKKGILFHYLFTIVK